MTILIIFLSIVIIIYNLNKKWNVNRPLFYPKKHFIIIGHRGAPILAKENTMESFIKAFSNNVDGIELDIQLTKDNKILVYHDFYLYNIKKNKFKIKNIKYSEINKKNNTNKYKIHLLDEVLKIIPNNKFINIEVKSQSYNNKTIIKKLLEKIKNNNLEKNVIISSFNPFLLRSIKRISKINTAFLLSNENQYLLFNTPLWIYFCKPDSLHIDIKNLNKNFTNWARKKNLSIIAFTVNNFLDLIKAKKYNVDGIFTDNPNIELINKNDKISPI